MNFEDFFNTLDMAKVKIALKTEKQFRFTDRGDSISIWYDDGGYTSFFKKDLYKRYKTNMQILLKKG
jgi:hypothetical protein